MQPVPPKIKANDKPMVEASTPEEAMAIKKDIAGLLVRNYTSAEIARQLGISGKKVASYINSIREEWGQLTSSNFKEFQAQELIKLEQIEREAWIAWESSKKSRKKKRSVYRDWETDRKSTRLNSSHRL